MYLMEGKLLLGFSHAFDGSVLEIEDLARQTKKFLRDVGCKLWGSLAEVLWGVTCIANGQMNKGLKILQAESDSCRKNGRKTALVMSEYILGKVFLQVSEGTDLPSFSFLARNIGFLVKNAPAAGKKAEVHLTKAIEIAKKIGANTWMARAYLDLGYLHQAKKRTGQAKECLSKAVELFERCEAEVYLQQAKEALASLD